MDGFEVERTIDEGIWAGIDPGKHGYVVAVHPNDKLEAWPAPLDDDGNYIEADMLNIAAALKAMGVLHVTLEAQQPTHLRPGQQRAGMANSAVRASFMTGFGFALWRMALIAAGFVEVTFDQQPGNTFSLAWPSHWKKKMGITVPKGFTGNRDTEVKNLARERATQQWPDHDFRKSSRARKPSPDQCEAALLAMYGMGRFLDAVG